SLAEELKSELRSHLEDVVLGLLMTPLSLTPSYSGKPTKALFEAGEEMDGIDISVFIDILTRRNGFQLAKIKCAWSKPAFFAEKLHKAMERHGTCEDTLMRVMVSRSEVDLKKIIAEFQIMYGKSLQDYIVEDTKGHFEKILLGLCGPY
ncbi:hypothetical protein CRUP_025014, partial [Coryphaenoides rupestris]